MQTRVLLQGGGTAGHPNEPEEGKASQGTGQAQRLRGLLE